MVENQGIHRAEGLDGQIHRSPGEGEIRNVTAQHLNLFRVLVLECLEGFDAAGNEDEVVCGGLLQEIFCGC